jgi:hypothetical protein
MIQNVYTKGQIGNQPKNSLPDHTIEIVVNATATERQIPGSKK